MTKRIVSLNEYLNEGINFKKYLKKGKLAASSYSFSKEAVAFIRKWLDFGKEVDDIYMIPHVTENRYVNKDYEIVEKRLGKKLGELDRNGEPKFEAFEGNGNSNVIKMTDQGGHHTWFLLDADAIVEAAKPQLTKEPRSLNEVELSYVDDCIASLPELEKLIQKRLGMKCKLSGEIKSGRRGDEYLKVTSNDLMSEYGKNPIVKACFAKINVDFWGGTPSQKEENSIWFNPKLSYEHPSGGSNGTQFLWDSLWFKDGKWVEGDLVI